MVEGGKVRLVFGVAWFNLYYSKLIFNKSLIFLCFKCLFIPTLFKDTHKKLDLKSFDQTVFVFKG